MKTLELQKMEGLEGGGNGFWSGLACGMFVLTMVASSVPTAGASLLIGAGVGAVACGGALGYDLN